MMKITVRLELTMAKYRLKGEKEFTLDLTEGSMVLTVLEYLGIMDTEPKLIVKNGRVAFPEDAVSHGDVIIILPVLESG